MGRFEGVLECVYGSAYEGVAAMNYGCSGESPVCGIGPTGKGAGARGPGQGRKGETEIGVGVTTKKKMMVLLIVMAMVLLTVRLMRTTTIQQLLL